MCMHPVTDFGGALLLAHCQQVRFLCLAGGMLLSMKDWREARVQCHKCQDLNKGTSNSFILHYILHYLYITSYFTLKYYIIFYVI